MIVVISLVIVVVFYPTNSLPVDREPLCRMSSNEVLSLIRNPGHQFNVVGSDASFDSFAERRIAQKGNPYGVKSKDFWLLNMEDDFFEEDEDEESENSRKSRRLHDDSQEYLYKPVCKSVPTYERRFNKFPFIRASWSCEPNPLLTFSLPIECRRVMEDRPILRLRGGCQSFLTNRDEEWVHSTERVVTGCQAVAKFTTGRNGLRFKN